MNGYKKLTPAEELAIIEECVALIKLRAPKRTGNLAYNAVKYGNTASHVWEIWVDGTPPDEGVAPYMPYTNEPWVSEKWRNRKTGEMRRNPNEGWFDRAVKECMELIAARLGGRLEEQ